MQLASRPTGSKRAKEAHVVPEARLAQTDGGGLVPESEGWFVVNAREARWWSHEYFGSAVTFEAEGDELGFPDFGSTSRS